MGADTDLGEDGVFVGWLNEMASLGNVDEAVTGSTGNCFGRGPALLIKDRSEGFR